MKRKFFVAALVLILALAMLPSFALADGPLDQLKADISAAPANGTETRVELTGNITGFTTEDIITIQEGQNIVLDMNGYSITVASDFTGRPLMNYGTLTMTGNGTIDSSASNTGGYGAIDNYGTLTIENGTYTGSVNASGSSIKNRAGKTLTIYGGTFNGAVTAVYNAGNAYIFGGTFDCHSCSACNSQSWGYTIQSHQDTDGILPNLYFYDGTVIGVQGAFSTSAGYSEIRGGSFTTVSCDKHPNGSSAFYALYIAGESGEVECNVYDGLFTSVSREAVHVGNNAPGDGGDRLPALVNIYGGEFNGGANTAVNVDYVLGGLEVVGGTFSSDVSTYVSKSATTSSDGGKTVVTPNKSDNAFASIERGGNTLYYTSLNDAVAEARDGETVEVLKSTTIDKALDIKNNITIDGNGNTVTANECVGLYIKADLNKLTVTDLTLKGVLGSDNKAYEGTGSFMGIGTYDGCYGVGDLKLTNVTVDGFSYGLYLGKNPAGGSGPYNENPVRVTANNLTVQNCYIKGAYFEKLTDSSFTSCTFADNGTDPNKVASESMRTWMCGVDINLKNGSYKNISFTGCTFTDNGKNNGTALLIKARDDGSYGKDTSLNGATVSGCTFSGNNGTAPVIIGEPGKSNKTPVNVSIQSDVKYTSNVAAASSFTVAFNSNGGTEYATQLVAAGSEITLPTPTKSGYIFLGWRCGESTYNAGAAVKVEKDMTFTAVWGNLPDVKPDTKPDQPVVTEFPFYDVAASAWYYNAVKYVYDKGLMDGVDTHEFAPNATLTRAMVWAILARAEGVNTTGGSTWYAKAQEWAVAKGVSDGENPNAAITREQLVTMLYRLAGSPSVTGSLTAPDASSVSSWAKDAMLWAMKLGLVEGDENGAVTPTATATRAQAAAIIMRYTAK